MSYRIRTAAFVLYLALAARAASGGAAFEAPEYLSPEERAERELERKKQAPAVLEVTPSRLVASVQEGDAATARLTVSNAGGRTLAWRTASLPRWARVSPENGAVGFQGRQTVTVSLSSESLRTGRSRGVIVVEAAGAGGSPVSVQVELDVTRPPKESPPAPPTVPPVPEAPPVGVREGGEVFRDAWDGRTRPGVRFAFRGPSAGGYRTSPFGVTIGGFTRTRWSARRSAFLEVGLDLAVPEEDDAGYSTVPVGGRLDVVWRLGAGTTRDTGGFLVSGVSAFVEFVEYTHTGDAYTNYAGALNLGAGVTFPGRKTDFRATLMIFLGSDNYQAMTMLGFAHVF